MSGALDMSLEDLIKKNKKPGGGNLRGRGGGRGSGPGPDRRIPNRASSRTGPYSTGKAPGSTWQHDMFSDPMVTRPLPGAARVSAIETGTKLYISNLDYGVSNDDIKELFSEVGDLKRFSIHYDRSGRSKKSRCCSCREKVQQCAARWEPMKIDIVGTNVMTPAIPVPQISNGLIGNPNGVLRSAPVRSGPVGWSRGGGRGRGRGGRRPGRGPGGQVSAADLDAELDKYHTEAMQTN
ncbi:unnamed protein product [Spirodela intermedia]|uniref:RRM domain-containing protein n=1 Tax=Spirodela intermedia TaxID=51605 RepID=A0A7I8IB49_SPIIN|nr:unnamed protein product [Spirodela intermedia]CAA6654935.1 unnamed protein product [Spirodela intermedia]